MAEIKSGIILSLKDLFSPGMKNAGKASTEFKDKALKAANAIDHAFSSVGAKIASLGVTIGAAALVKASIDYEDSIIRIGTNAGMSGAEVNQFRRELLAVAQDAKVPVQELVKFSQVVTDNSIGLDVASESARFMADAMQGLGLSGQEAGDILSVLVNKGADIDTVKQKLNNLAEIDNRLQGMGLSEFAKKLPQLLEASEGSIDNIEDLYISILTLNNGATNKQALTQYTSAMEDFAKSRNEIRKYVNGFDVKDENGDLKGFAEIMTALVDKGKEVGSFDQFQKAFHFSDNTLKAIKQFNSYSGETIDKVKDLGDTSNAVSGRADQNAKSLASNLVSLQNNILKLADATLTKPIERLAKLLDEHPKGMENAIKGVAAALAVLAGMKAFSTVATFLGQLKGLKGGAGKLGGGMMGGMGMPVYVTNWGGGMGMGGGAGDGMMPGPSGKPSAKGKPGLKGKLPIKGGKFLGGVSKGLGVAGRALGWAAMLAPFVITEVEGFQRLNQINKAKADHKKYGYGKNRVRERSIPAPTNEEIKLQKAMRDQARGYALTPPRDDMGHADINLKVDVTDERISVSAVTQSNSTPFKVNPGSAVEARRTP